MRTQADVLYIDGVLLTGEAKDRLWPIYEWIEPDFRGGPSADGFNERSAELGTKFNGSPREERVNCRFTLPADSLEGGLRFLASALRGPLFLEDTPGKYWMGRMAA